MVFGRGKIFSLLVTFALSTALTSSLFGNSISCETAVSLAAPEDSSGTALSPKQILRKKAAEKAAEDFERFLVLLREQGVEQRMPNANIREKIEVGSENSLRQRIAKFQYEPAFLERLSPATRGFLESRRPGTLAARSGDIDAAAELMSFLEGLRANGQILRLPSNAFASETPLINKINVRRLNPGFLERLSPEAKELVEKNITLMDAEGPIQAALDLGTFLEGLAKSGEPLRLPDKYKEEEKALSHKVRMYLDHPLFIERLSPEIKTLIASMQFHVPPVNPAQRLNLFFKKHGRLPSSTHFHRRIGELSAEQAEEARAYRGMVHKWNEPEFLKALEEEVREAIVTRFRTVENPDPNFSAAKKRERKNAQVIASAKRLASFVETNGHLPRSQSPRNGEQKLPPDRNAENNLYHIIYRNSENADFLNALPEAVREKVEQWSAVESVFEYTGPEAAAERIGFYYRTHGNRLPKMMPSDRKLYSFMNYYCESLEFLEALPLTVAKAVIEWRHTVIRAPAPSPEELARQITVFYYNQRRLPKSQYRKGYSFTKKKREETRLYSYLSYRSSNEAFLNLLSEDVKAAVQEWRSNIAPRGPEAAAKRTIEFWDSHGHRLPTHPHTDGIGGHEWNLYYLVRKHWGDPTFLDALPDPIKIQVEEWRDATIFGEP